MLRKTGEVLYTLSDEFWSVSSLGLDVFRCADFERIMGLGTVCLGLHFPGGHFGNILRVVALGISADLSLIE